MTLVKKEHRIVLLSTYFGPTPWYFPYFVLSCRYNPSVDFLLFADHETGLELPPNVRFIKMTLEAFRRKATSVLGFDVVTTPQPYKICDLRPAFGLLFHEYVQEYDFWGQADTDILFGNIRKFLDDTILDNYDMICLRHDYISSWFTLYRNNERMNHLFKESSDYKKVFTTERYFNFDETNLTFFEFAHSVPYQQIPSEVESMTHLVKRLQEQGAVRAYFDMHAIEGRPGRMIWSKGQLIYKNQFEVLLYHLLEFKKVYQPKHRPEKVKDTFRISPARIY